MSGYRNLEWILRARITAGLQQFRSNPALVDSLFVDLSANTRAAITDYLQRQSIQVLLGYPRNTEDLPCWTLMMEGEQRYVIPIGQQFDHEQTVGVSEGNDLGEYVKKNYQIMTLSLDPDLTLILATILQMILKSMRADLDLEGFHQMEVAQTDALSLQVQYLPNFLYVRNTAVSVIVQDSLLYVDTSLPTSINTALNLNVSIPAPSS